MPHLVNREKFYTTSCTIEDLPNVLLFKSFDEYKAQGGKMNEYQLYFKLLERAKKYESNYIQHMDMLNSGVLEDNDDTRNKLFEERKNAQVFYVALSVIFNRKPRVVSFNTFDLKEFNQMC